MRKLLRQLATKITIVAILASLFSASVYAVGPDVIVYEGRLLSPAGAALTTTHTFRFSLWSSSDLVMGDIAAGTINVAAPNFSDWQEVHTITPNSNGTFSVQLGSVVPLPDIDYDKHKFLQVEVKQAGELDVAYQVLDPTGDLGADTDDREVIGSAPFAIHSQIADKSNQETFAVDADDSIFNAGTGSVKLSFGNNLGKFLEYDLDNGYFNFNDDVNIQGNLTVSGLINGVNINDLPTSTHVQNTDSGTDKDTFEINTDGNSITLDTAGLTQDITATFEDADMALVGKDNVQILTNKTIDGNLNTITNIDLSSLKDVNKAILLIPAYTSLLIDDDGTDNQATIYQGYDELQNHQYYVLSSAKATLQDLDMTIEVKIPEDFQGWQAVPLEIFVKSSSNDVATNKIDVTLDDTNNVPIALNGGTGLKSSMAEVWESKAITFLGAHTFTPGQTMTLKIKMSANTHNRIYISEIKFNYIGK